MSDLTPNQRDLARHALGLDGRRKQSYRNRFVTAPGSTIFLDWLAMVSKGLAWHRPGNEFAGGADLFGLTLTGARAALNRGERLCPEDFPLNNHAGG